MAPTTPTPHFAIRTPRLLLRPLQESDRAEFVRVHEVSRAFFSPWTPLTAVGQSSDTLFTEVLERQRLGMEAGKELRLAAFLDDGRLAGLLNLNEIVRGAFHNAYAGWRVNVEIAK